MQSLEIKTIFKNPIFYIKDYGVTGLLQKNKTNKDTSQQ